MNPNHFQNQQTCHEKYQCTTLLSARPAQLEQHLGYNLDNQGFDFQQGQEIFFSAETSKPAVRLTKRLIQWISSFHSSVLKQLGYKNDHSPSSSAEVKNEWNYISTPPTFLMVMKGQHYLYLHIFYHILFSHMS